MVIRLRKFITNNAVALTLVLPNLVISGGTQALLVVYLHWTGWMAFLAWMLGAGLGFEYGVLFSMLSKSQFQIGKWRYNYSTKGDGVEKAT